MAPGSLDVGGAEAVDQSDREIAEGGQNLWGVAGAQAGTVFPKADITHIMGSILDTPMPTIEVQQALWTGLGGGEGGDEINDLGGDFARLGHGASELSDLRDKGPGWGKIGIHLGTDLDGASFGASPSAVKTVSAPNACMRRRNSAWVCKASAVQTRCRMGNAGSTCEAPGISLVFSSTRTCQNVS